MGTFAGVRGILDSMREDGAVIEMSEQALVERARRGDRDAFDRIVSTNLAHVWRVVWRVLRHHEDTEDVVQEVLLAAYQGLAGFRGEAKLSTWLQRIAVTRALNHLDRAAEKVRRASRPFEARAGEQEAGGSAEPGVEDPSRVPSPLQALEAKELRRRLAECLSRLPPPWRAALALRDGEHLAYDDIAAALGIALGTVRSRLARARLALRRCVEGEAS